MAPSSHLALLVLRLSAFLLLCFGHGTQKWTTLNTDPSAFPDPLGLGHVPALICAMGAECVMSLAVGLGLLTRLCCLPILFTMGTVALVVHHGHPWMKTEPSVLFFLIYLTIALTGPGRYSIDFLRQNALQGRGLQGAGRSRRAA